MHMIYRLAAVAVTAWIAMPVQASAPTQQVRETAVAITAEAFQLARGGCGSKGGPGYRKANGKCAGWRG
ncbi:hypothetical protein SAMN05880592_105155 [Bosea sp. TND4EK4]|nr:hypothetical protein SAMN05880592_105155 [Bosea sp. TND4EK4]